MISTPWNQYQKHEEELSKNKSNKGDKCVKLDPNYTATFEDVLAKQSQQLTQ